MSNIEKFDPNSVMDGVRDRIKATFVSLIPDDQWTALIKAEADKFFTHKERNWGSQYNEVTPFMHVVNHVMMEVAKQKVKEFISTYESNTWSFNQIEMNEKLKTLLLENSQQIIASAFGGMFQQVINNMPRG